MATFEDSCVEKNHLTGSPAADVHNIISVTYIWQSSKVHAR